MAKTNDAQIDRLFQLPLDEFTAARNALAKESGKGGAEIKQLSKPPVAAWAVNQLYWSRRAEYEALIRAAEEMRRTHKAVIEGGRGDLREAGREHERALDAALKATLAAVKDAGQPVTEATRHAILNTLRALPSDEAPGRLTRALTPGGFEMLSGFKPAKGKPSTAKREPTKGASPRRESASSPDSRAAATAAKAEMTAAKERAEREAAERAVRSAEHAARRTEFDAARTARDATRADKRLEEAREALRQAREELDAAEKGAAAAKRAKDAAEKKSRDAESALEAARAKLRR